MTPFRPASTGIAPIRRTSKAAIADKRTSPLNSDAASPTPPFTTSGFDCPSSKTTSSKRRSPWRITAPPARERKSPSSTSASPRKPASLGEGSSEASKRLPSSHPETRRTSPSPSTPRLSASSSTAASRRSPATTSSSSAPPHETSASTPPSNSFSSKQGFIVLRLPAALSPKEYKATPRCEEREREMLSRKQNIDEIEGLHARLFLFLFLSLSNVVIVAVGSLGSARLEKKTQTRRWVSFFGARKSVLCVVVRIRW
mmetsp:Transcript_28810/g.92783  ORF Transcript_28810/g.92783 Transcript_28810/m.92783 type:complete len:257 (+) Transcript_28810:1567-2337(+)